MSYVPLEFYFNHFATATETINPPFLFGSTVHFTIPLRGDIEPQHYIHIRLPSIPNDQKQINYLDKFTIVPNLNTEEQCSICFEIPKEVYLLKCNHLFCVSCLDVWCKTEKTCPLCRQCLVPKLGSHISDID